MSNRLQPTGWDRRGRMLSVPACYAAPFMAALLVSMVLGIRRMCSATDAQVSLLYVACSIGRARRRKPPENTLIAPNEGGRSGLGAIR